MQPPFQPPPNQAPPYQAPPYMPPPGPPAPRPSPPTPPPVRREIRVMDALRFTTSGPSGWTNLLFCGLLYLSIQFIPIVGLIVMQGFFAEVHRRLVLQRPEPYLRFDFSDLGSYLTRGLAPIVMTLLVAMPFGVLLAGIIVAGLIAGNLGERAGGDASLVVPLVLGGGALLWLPLSVLWLALQNAAVTRAELTGDVGKSLKLGELWAYAGKTWKRVFWTGLVSSFIGIGLLVLGLLACGIGMFLTMSMALVLQLHLRWQIYNAYLLEGGEPIELAPWETLASEAPKAPPPGPVPQR